MSADVRLACFLCGKVTDDYRTYDIENLKIVICSACQQAVEQAIRLITAGRYVH
jgi:electron transfer flavoprotein alpha/beta subunit